MISPSTSFLFALFTFQVLLRSVLGGPVVAEKYSESDWDHRSGCTRLQVDNSIQNANLKGVLTDTKLFLLTNIKTLDSTYNELLIGSIGFSTSFTTTDYEIEWFKSPNYTYRPSFLAGDSSRLTFVVGTNGLRANESEYSMVNYDPVGHSLDVIAWPPQVTRNDLPSGPLVAVPEKKTAYYLGGYPYLVTPTVPTQVYAYNYSDGTLTIKPAPDRTWSSAVFVPVGGKGVLIVLAGKQMDQGQWVPVAMDEIHVYDIESEVWYLQKTSGDVPVPRDEICAVLVSAPDDSSHQIHIYGGSLAGDINRLPLLDNYYVLSVPGFVYTEVNTTAKPSVSGSCQKLGSHKMIVVGGRDKLVDAGCNTLFEVIDLNTFTVTDSLRDDGEYQVPNEVVSAIGGGPTGGATMLKPASGFEPGLDSVFAKKYIAVPVISNNTAPPPADPKKTGVPIGAIAGAAVGGSITLLLAIVWWRWRRSKLHGDESTTAITQEEENFYPEMEAIHRSVPEMESVASPLAEMESVLSTRVELYGGPVIIPELDAGPVTR